MSSHPLSSSPHSELYQCMHNLRAPPSVIPPFIQMYLLVLLVSSYKYMQHAQSLFHYMCTDVHAPTITMVTPGKNLALPLHALPPVSLHYTAVGEPTNVTVTAGLNSISLEWSPPSEGSPLSYTVTWTGSGVTSSHVLPPTAHNYTIRGLDSNTAYSVQVSDNTTNATVSWNEYTLPQGELVFQSNSKAVNSRSDISFKLYIVCFTFATIHTVRLP